MELCYLGTKMILEKFFEVADETTMINARESYQVIQHNEPSALCIECCDCERVD